MTVAGLVVAVIEFSARTTTRDDFLVSHIRFVLSDCCQFEIYLPQEYVTKASEAISSKCAYLSIGANARSHTHTLDGGRERFAQMVKLILNYNFC